jgi:putative transposase
MKSRRSTHLADYDYTSAGAYFVTLVTYGRECFFGDVINGKIVVNEWGYLAKNEWWCLASDPRLTPYSWRASVATQLF